MALDEEHPFLEADLNPLPPPRHIGWGEKWRCKALSTLVPMVWGENCCSSEWYTAVADIFGHYLVYSQETTAPTQADLLIITGHVSEKAVPSLLALVRAMPDPHFVMAVGACTQLGEPCLPLPAGCTTEQVIQQAYAVDGHLGARKSKSKDKIKEKNKDHGREKNREAEGEEESNATSADLNLGREKGENNVFLARPLSQIIPVDIVIAGCPPTPQALAQGVRLLETMIKAGYRGQRPPL